MKKMLKKFVTLCIAFTFTCTANAAPVDRQLREKIVNGENYVDIAEADGNVSQEAIDKANDALNLLPETMLERFRADGWNFFVTNQDINKKYYPGLYGKIYSVVDFDNHCIFIQNGCKEIKGTVLHEFGRYLDYMYGNGHNMYAFAIPMYYGGRKVEFRLRYPRQFHEMKLTFPEI